MTLLPRLNVSLCFALAWMALAYALHAPWQIVVLVGAAVALGIGYELTIAKEG
jgi:hypothetical protein